MFNIKYKLKTAIENCIYHAKEHNPLYIWFDKGEKYWNPMAKDDSSKELQYIAFLKALIFEYFTDTGDILEYQYSQTMIQNIHFANYLFNYGIDYLKESKKIE